jgi:hypothetical protein
MVLCAPNTGASGSILLRVPAGRRRFKLEYAGLRLHRPEGPGSPTRWLWIRTVPTS